MDPETGEGDLVDPDQGSDIGTAAILSMATERTARPDDNVPERRGYWGDAYPAVPGDRFGSRNWQLQLDVDDTLRRAEDFAEESWDWALEDGIATAVSSSATRISAGHTCVDTTVHIAGEVRERVFRRIHAT